MRALWIVLAALPLPAPQPAEDFGYDYPARARAIPALRAELDRRAARLRAWFRSGAAAARRSAAADKRPYYPWEQAVDWSVVADTPRFLSLSAQTYSYTGGAHPNHGYTALLWDKRAGRALKATDLFASRTAFNGAFRRSFCAELDRQRAKRRAGESIAPGDMFTDCIDPTASTLILGSSDARAFDRIGVLIAPYEAGPYVEGDYEVTLPVTPAVLATVRPVYRAAFRLGRQARRTGRARRRPRSPRRRCRRARGGRRRGAAPGRRSPARRPASARSRRPPHPPRR